MSATRCAAHHNVETNLRCGKCGKPICPKCLVQTPVGARCRECANLYRLPTYRVSTQYYLRAIGTTLVMAIILGVIWGVLEVFLPFFLGLLLGPGAGYAISELVSRATNRKRGPGLAAIAGAGVVISYLVSVLVLSVLGHGGLTLIPLSLLSLALGIFVAVTRLR